MKKLKLCKPKDIRSLLIEVFRIKGNKQKKYDSENIQNWDSLGHMLMIEKIEKKYRIKISSKDVGKLQSEKELIRYLNNLK